MNQITEGLCNEVPGKMSLLCWSLGVLRSLMCLDGSSGARVVQSLCGILKILSLRTLQRELPDIPADPVNNDL